MKPTYRTAALCAAVALSAGLSSAAWAQAEPHRPPPEFRAMREAHERQRAQDLRTILRLRPDQEAALAAFLQSHEAPMPPHERGGRPGGALTTPQRLDEQTRRETEHAQMRQRRTDAVRAFYAALSPDQRPVFDALMRIERGHRHGGLRRQGPGGRPGAHPGG